MPPRPISFALVVLALLLAPLAAARSAEPLRIRAGWINAPSSLMPILFAETGIARHEGKSYILEPVHFSASTTELTAAAAGDLEIAPLGFSSFSIAVENAGLTDLRIIADEARDGVDGYSTVEYRVRRDGPITSVADLKGKILATNGIGSGADIGMRAMLAQHYLQVGDYTELEAGFANMRALLDEHKVDLIAAPLPFKYDPALERLSRTLFTLKDALGPTELSFWTARQSFLKAHRAAVVDLLEDMVRAVRWYTNPAHHHEAIRILAQFTKRPAQNLDAWAFTRKDNYRDPDAMPDLAQLQSNIHAQRQLGFVKADLDVARYADLSLLKAALRRVN